MTNAFKRGSAPGRERDASQRPGSFKPGHKKIGGRKTGTPNALSTDYKRAVLAAANLAGRDGKGTDGLVGYFTRLLAQCPDVGCMLLERMFLHEDYGWPPEGRTLSKEQVNAEVRDLIASSAEPAPGTQWPVPDLIRLAVKHPKAFGKLLAALVPPPPRRPRRAWTGV